MYQSIHYLYKNIKQLLIIIFFISTPIFSISTPINYNKSIITIPNNDLDTIIKKMHPGDILLKHNNYNLLNLFVRGFWTHSAIYLGSVEEIDQYFNEIPMLNNEKPSEYIKKMYPEVFNSIFINKYSIIEAISPSVAINPLEHIAKVDYLGVLRPRLSKEDIFKALLSSFQYYGKPYDFMINIKKDNKIYCSELLFNAYLPNSNKKGIQFRTRKIMNKPIYFPSDFVAQFVNELNTENHSFEYVMYCKPKKNLKKIEFQNEIEFCKTF
jgi:hypothetical protein